MILNNLLNFFNFNPSMKLACLVSGGVDSMVLMESLYRCFKEISFDLTVMHFNHHLRGDESVRDETFVQKEASLRGLTFLAVQAPIKKGSGIQERARKARIEVLQKLSREHGWSHVFTGHHADDQAETVLMRLIRGAGVRGLKGMERESFLIPKVQLVRPFLTVSRDQISQFARQEGICFVEDSSNQKDDYFRNRVRHQILPALKKEFPGILSSIQQSCDLLCKEDRVLDEKVCRFLELSRHGSQEFSIDRFFQEEPAVRFRLLEKLLKENGFKNQVTSSHFEEIVELFRKERPVEREFGEAFLRCGYGRFCIERKDTARCAPTIKDWHMEISGPGKYWMEPLGEMLVLESGDRGSGVGDQERQKEAGKRLCLNSEKIKFPLTVRLPQPGDRFRPFGMKGSKKLSDYFIDRKIPKEKRRTSPVFCQGDEVLCVIGFEIDDRYKLPSFNQKGIVVYTHSN